MNRPPAKIQAGSVWNFVPTSIRPWLSNVTPSVTRIGPSAKTGKYRAQKVAPIIAERAAPKLLTRASGGERMRLTQT